MDIEQYRPVVGAWERFLDASRREEPVTLRVHTGRTRPEELRARLEALGFRLEPVPGLPAFLRVLDQPYPLSRTLEHWLGLFYLQQAVTGVAPLALGAAPGERILDLCAAPGGKTAHLADLVGEKGMVVASDRSGKRIRALLGNLYRMGHASVMVLEADGRSFPGGVSFDRVLADVPCSAEGNLRRSGGALPRRSPRFLHRITAVQEALLRRAVDLARPGGQVLYVTCTFSPEENERVVARVLADLPVSVEPIALDLPHDPGLARFGGDSFPAELRHAWRLYPHHLNSGGLFMALLLKEEEPTAASPAPAEGWGEPPLVHPEDPDAREEAGRVVEAGLARLAQWTGVARERLEGERWMVRGDSIWVHGCRSWPLDAWEGQGPAPDWQFVSAGLRAFRLGRSGPPVPTNDLLRRLGPALRDRVVHLERGSWVEMLERGGIALPGTGDGYVALALEGVVIGRGRARSGRLVSEIPRAQAHFLVRALDPSPVGSGDPGGSVAPVGGV